MYNLQSRQMYLYVVTKSNEPGLERAISLPHFGQALETNMLSSPRTIATAIQTPNIGSANLFTLSSVCLAISLTTAATNPSTREAPAATFRNRNSGRSGTGRYSLSPSAGGSSVPNRKSPASAPSSRWQDSESSSRDNVNARAKRPGPPRQNHGIIPFPTPPISPVRSESV